LSEYKRVKEELNSGLITVHLKGVLLLSAIIMEGKLKMKKLSEMKYMLKLETKFFKM
jgi:hypothetical protein